MVEKFVGCLILALTLQLLPASGKLFTLPGTRLAMWSHFNACRHRADSMLEAVVFRAGRAHAKVSKRYRMG